MGESTSAAQRAAIGALSEALELSLLVVVVSEPPSMVLLVHAACPSLGGVFLDVKSRQLCLWQDGRSWRVPPSSQGHAPEATAAPPERSGDT